MKYYRIYDNISFPDRWFLGDLSVEDNWVFTIGTAINENDFKNLTIEIDKVGIPLDYTESDAGGVPIVSESFAELLYDYMNEIQLIPVSVPNTTNSYFILVAKNEIECVDEEKSDFQIFEEGNDIRPDLAGEYKVINVLKIDRTKVDKHIFRIAKYDVVLIVSEEIMNKLKESQLVGFKFKLVS